MISILPQSTLQVLLFQMATTTLSAAIALMALIDHVLQKLRMPTSVPDQMIRFRQESLPRRGTPRTSLALSFLSRARCALSAPEHADYIWL